MTLAPDRSRNTETIEATLRRLRILHAAMMGAVVLYFWIGERIRPSEPRQPSPVIYVLLGATGAVFAGMTLWFRKKAMESAEEASRVNPGDAQALARLRMGYIVSFAFAETVVLFGFVLRVLGASLLQVAPFYAVGLFLLLLCTPRRF